MRQAEAWNAGTGFCLPGPADGARRNGLAGTAGGAGGAGGPGCIRGRAGPCRHDQGGQATDAHHRLAARTANNLVCTNCYSWYRITGAGGYSPVKGEAP